MNNSRDVLQAWQLTLGPIVLSNAVLVTWIIMLLIGAGGWLMTRHLKQKPGRLQTLLEGGYETMYGAIADVLPKHAAVVFPFIASLWSFIVVANLIGIVPGFDAPTSNLSTTASLALIVFLSVHWYGIRTQGLKRYVEHYLEPNPLLLPFTVISEITRTVALAVRLFGNMMSLGLTAMLVLMVAGFLAPVPILMLHIIEALVQAYIFGMLALIYIASGIQVQELQISNKE